MHLLELREPVSSLTHGAWLLLSLPATLFLLRRSDPDRGRQVSLLIYGLSMAACAAGSTVYHGLTSPPWRIVLFSHLDHIGIAVFIAGSYTPIAWNLLRGRWRRRTLTLAWLAALVAAALRLSFGMLPAPVSTTFFLVMGWGSILCYLELARGLSHRELAPILVGGLLYSVGAVFHVTRWPVLWAGRFEAHELFHLFVMAGCLSHWEFMRRAVASPAPAFSEERGSGAPGSPPGIRRRDPAHPVSAGTHRWWIPFLVPSDGRRPRG